MNDDFRRLVPAPSYQSDDSNPFPAKSEDQLSLRAGGIETIRFTSPPTRYSFRAEGEEIGVFMYDTDEKAWKFDGVVDESAKLFIKYVLNELSQ